MRVFVAGGSGAVGRRLVPQLVARGHQVTATTTSAAKLGLLEQLGAEAVVIDGLDAVSVDEAVAAARPDAIVHQMTGLSFAHAGKPDFRHPERFGAITNRLRTEGTDYLLAAARATGVPHIVAQSFAIWLANRERGVVTEDESLPLQELPAKWRIMAQPLRYLEDVVVKAGGAALRYGGFYGPGGGVEDQIELVRKRRLPIIGSGTGYFSGCTSTTRRALPSWLWSSRRGACSTSWTTNRRRSASGCLIWPRAWGRSARCGSPSGWSGRWPAKWGLRS